MTLQHGHRVTSPSTGMLPGKGAGGPLLPRATRRQRGGGTRLASVGSSYPLLRRPRTCQGVSPSLSSFSSITPSNADCCMPHPCGAAALLSTPVIVSAEISRLEARGEGVSPALPPSLPSPSCGRAQPAPHPASGGWDAASGQVWHGELCAPAAAERGLNHQENAEILRRTRKIKPHKVKI